MPKRKREFDWEVIRLQASPAKFIGYVRAPDEETARGRDRTISGTTRATTVALDPKGMTTTDRCRGASVDAKLSRRAEPVAPCQDARAIAKQHHAAWISRDKVPIKRARIN